MKKIFETELDKVAAVAARAWQYGATPSEVAAAAKRGVKAAMSGAVSFPTVKRNGWRRRQAAQTRRRRSWRRRSR